MSGGHTKSVGESFALGGISQAVDLQLDDAEEMGDGDWDACEEVLYAAERDPAQHADAEEVSVLVGRGEGPREEPGPRCQAIGGGF